MTTSPAETPIVFLHIPKTAGQTIHNALAAMVGARHVSPVRVHTQAQGEAPQMPAGYRLYSGHLDWTEAENLPDPRFAFTVLRDPRERIASFYFFLMKEARALSEAELAEPRHAGKRRLLTHSAEGYFFAGNPGFRQFIRDHYDNFYCSYFATRRMRGQRALQGLSEAEKVRAALANAPLIDRIYSTRDLAALEADIAERYGKRISVTDTFVNAGTHDRAEKRWPKLVALMESDAGVRRLEEFASADLALIEALGLEV